MRTGEKIYGPIEYDARVYYDYLYSEAKERMIKEVLVNQIREGQIKDFAQKNEIKIKGEKDKQQIRYQLAKEMYMAGIKKREYCAVIKKY